MLIKLIFSNTALKSRNNQTKTQGFSHNIFQLKPLGVAGLAPPTMAGGNKCMLVKRLLTQSNSEAQPLTFFSTVYVKLQLLIFYPQPSTFNFQPSTLNLHRILPVPAFPSSASHSIAVAVLLLGVASVFGLRDPVNIFLLVVVRIFFKCL